MSAKICTVLMFLTLLSCGVSRPINSRPIFRHVNLDAYGKIKLGQNISKFDSLIQIEGDKKFLKARIIGGAESIQLVPDLKGKIIAVIFKYGGDSDLKSTINDYMYLGIPKKADSTASWNDGKTTFEVFEENGNVYSKMTDISAESTKVN